MTAQVGDCHDGAQGAWATLATTLLLSAPPWVDVYRDRVAIPDGPIIDDFYRVLLAEFALMAVLTPEAELVMLRGYTHGVGRSHLFVPGGLVERDEPPLLAARRELLEETGYASDEWEPRGRFVSNGTRHCGIAHLFVARNAQRLQAPRDDVTERFEVVRVTAPHYAKAVQAGEVCTLQTLAAVSLAWAPGPLASQGGARP